MRAWALVGVFCVAGCSEAGDVVSVFAAASLREVVEDVAADYEAAHPGTKIRTVFAGSQTLRLQAEAGAPFDLFLSAHPEHVARLHADGRCEAPRRVARNRLAILVPADSPLRRLRDLASAERIVLGTPEVPVGHHAGQLLRRAGERFGPEWTAKVRAHVVSREKNVRLVRAKVALGEAGAALVYVTEARGDGMRAVFIDDALNPVAVYAAGVASAAGERLLDWLEGPRGRARLLQRGFLLP
jgi:molybdate transport system substrate-binding protein